MREKVLRYIRERGLLHAGDRVAVAVSGGADSVALLRLLAELRDELGLVLTAAHFNHRLRGEASEADAAFVEELARRLDLPFLSEAQDAQEYAAQQKLGIEAAARELRYRWLARVAAETTQTAVATAHTLDDQAETVLLKFRRGAGTRGLAGVYPEVGRDGARFVRPLLCIRRNEVEAYLASIGQDWREDESNLDHRFARNRVRHELLPLLEKSYNPGIRRLLSDSAETARAEELYWAEIVGRELADRATGEGFKLAGFEALRLALQRRLLKQFAQNTGLALDFGHVENLRHVATGRITGTELPGGWIAVSLNGRLALNPPQAANPCVAAGYCCSLTVPGEVTIPEARLWLRASLLAEEAAAEADETALLASHLIGGELELRNWRPGDRFQPSHSVSARPRRAGVKIQWPGLAVSAPDTQMPAETAPASRSREGLDTAKR